MDPLSVAAAFATIVGLISNYKSENKIISSDEYKAFLEWLQNKRHTEVIQYIEMNSSLVASIKQFLEQDNKLILQKLEAIDNITAKIASGIEGLAEIAKAIKSNQELSKQCISILKQLNENGSFFSELKTGSYPVFLIADGNGGTINYDEPCFIEDDIRTLIELRLLRIEHTNSGTRIFYLTREATSLLQT